VAARAPLGEQRLAARRVAGHDRLRRVRFLLRISRFSELSSTVHLRCVLCSAKEVTMNRRLILLIAAAVAGATLAGVAIAGGMGDDDKPLTGRTLERATAAALEHTGGGTVVETEAGDDGAAYGVEIRLANGRQVEVELDEDFRVIGQEADDDGPNDRDEEGEEE
jgi:uncharacterized membrane protein YkoI